MKRMLFVILTILSTTAYSQTAIPKTVTSRYYNPDGIVPSIEFGVEYGESTIETRNDFLGMKNPLSTTYRSTYNFGLNVPVNHLTIILGGSYSPARTVGSILATKSTPSKNIELGGFSLGVGLRLYFR